MKQYSISSFYSAPMFHSFMQHLSNLFWNCSPLYWVCLQIKGGIWKGLFYIFCWTYKALASSFDLFIIQIGFTQTKSNNLHEKPLARSKISDPIFSVLLSSPLLAVTFKTVHWPLGPQHPVTRTVTDTRSIGRPGQNLGEIPGPDNSVHGSTTSICPQCVYCFPLLYSCIVNEILLQIGP